MRRKKARTIGYKGGLYLLSDESIKDILGMFKECFYQKGWADTTVVRRLAGGMSKDLLGYNVDMIDLIIIVHYLLDRQEMSIGALMWAARYFNDEANRAEKGDTGKLGIGAGWRRAAACMLAAATDDRHVWAQTWPALSKGGNNMADKPNGADGKGQDLRDRLWAELEKHGYKRGTRPPEPPKPNSGATKVQ